MKDLYRYIVVPMKDGRTKTIAISTFAGKTVRGTAICDVRDTYDEELGKQIAATKCGEKIAIKRVKRAARKQLEAEKELYKAQAHFNRMCTYYTDAVNAVNAASDAVNSLCGI